MITTFMREIHPYSYDNADLINNRAELGHLRRLSRFDLDNGHSNSTSTMASDYGICIGVAYHTALGARAAPSTD